MWKLIGGGTVTHYTDLLNVGRVDVPLQNGMLFLKVSTTGAADWRPLSFGVVMPVAEIEDSGLPDVRCYPQQHPVLLALGPSPYPRFTGRIFWKARNYNRQWLRWGNPTYAMNLVVWAWDTGDSSFPGNWITGIIGRNNLRYRPSALRIGPAGAAPLEPHE